MAARCRAAGRLLGLDPDCRHRMDNGWRPELGCKGDAESVEAQR